MIMARRPNYGFQKHQKEMKKQQKRDAKLAKNQQKKDQADAGAVDETTATSPADTDVDKA
jgi:hypothetical protein